MNFRNIRLIVFVIVSLLSIGLWITIHVLMKSNPEYVGLCILDPISYIITSKIDGALNSVENYNVFLGYFIVQCVSLTFWNIITQGILTLFFRMKKPS